MSEPLNPENGAQAPGSPHDRLDSWKKIAAYLKRDVTTVQRWERREQLPVHRQLHDKQGSVFAYRGEIDRWWAARQAQLAQPQGAALPSGSAGGRAGRWYRSAMARGLVAAAALCGTGVVAWFGLHEESAWKDPLAGARYTRLLPDFSGVEQTAILSPDGKWLAFVAHREEGIDAWLADLDVGTYRNITQGRFHELVNPAVRTLGFSADSALMTVWNRSGDGTHPGDVSIQAAPVRGGPLQPYLSEAAEFDWSRNGKRLVYHTTGPGDPIIVRDSPTAAPRTIYTAPTGVHCHFPVWSPDETYIYFVRGVPPADWDLWRIRPDGSGLESLTQLHSRLSYPVLPDRHTLLYLATDHKGSGPWIYSLDLNRREAHRVSEGLESYSSLAASSDGLKLVATVASERTDLWKVALRDNGPATAPSLDRVVSRAERPRLGPGFLVYVTQRGNGQAIRILDHGTSREVWHRGQPGIIGAPSVSPDGLHIAFNLDTGRGMQLVEIDREGGHSRTIADSLVLQGSPAWRPDGQALVASVVSNGQPQLSQFFLDGRPPASLVAEYSSDPAWSPGGQFLIYTGADVGTTFPVRAAAPDGRAWPMPALMLTRGGRRLAFLPRSRELVYLGGSLGHKDLWAIDLRHDRKRLLVQLPPDFVASDFDISADGSEAVLEREESSSELALIERSN
jgi:Tol biopolymer transport system component